MPNPDLLFVTRDIVPCSTGSGSAVLCRALVDMFEKAGLTTEIIVFRTGAAARSGSRDADLDARIRTVDERAPGMFRRLRRLVAPTDSDYFIDPGLIHRELQQYDWKKTRFLCTYSWEPLSAHSAVPETVLSIASVVDLIENGRELRRQHGRRHQRRNLASSVLSRLRWRNQGAACTRLLAGADLVLEHASQHADELRGRGIRNVHYLPHPLPKRERLAQIPSETVRILIPGSFKGIASRIGFEYFFDELLPAFDQRREKLSCPCRFRVVGHGKMPEQFLRKLEQRADCEFGGYVDDIVAEYRNTDIILVNVPIPHGFRTRIAEAFSFGLCVVAHEANAVGMPELVDDTNILMAADPGILAEKLIRAINDSALRSQIAARARLDFETTISMDVAAARMRQLLELP
ncbi:MAG: glycosyltransferase family 4 protein [Planctomycetaceae bacterium]